jgi:hypothetical protein
VRLDGEHERGEARTVNELGTRDAVVGERLDDDEPGALG